METDDVSTVFRNHELLVRIRIPGSIRYLCPMDPDADPAIFISDLEDIKKKKFFCLLLFEGTFPSFFKDIKS